MPKLDPVTGPMSREEFAAAVAAPFGHAAKAIQKHDPMWGRAPGEKFAWRVRVEREALDRGTATVMADSQEEADKLADKLSDTEIDWDYGSDGFVVISVEPMKSR
jgi:hypothetical protein